MKEKLETLKEKLSKKEGLKAADMREDISELQKKSLKLFEAAYRKMAEKNAGPSADNAQTQPPESESEPKKEEQK